MHRILPVLLLPMALSGCAAVLVCGLIYHDSKTLDQRLAFTQDFRRQNLEREKVGLPPLNWCEEVYKFDQSWYRKDATCSRAAAGNGRADKS